MDKIKTIKLTKPVEWENTHIKAHEEINLAISQFNSHLNNLIDEHKNLAKMYEDADNRLTASFSEINKLKKENKELKETIGSIVKEIKNLKEDMSKWGKCLSINYEWIVDTDTQIVMELDDIELDWKQYLVNICVNEVIPNQWTLMYTLPDVSLTSVKYTPKVYLMAKQWEHAVLEYDFNVILTEI